MIDTHCHLHDPEFFDKKEQKTLLNQAHEAGVDKIICVGTSHEDSLKARDFASQHKNVFWSYGLHPSVLKDSALEDKFFHESYSISRGVTQTGGTPVSRAGDEHEMGARGLRQDPETKLIAIGEVGLEYHYYKDNHGEQIRLFEQMVDLAIKHNLPLIFHVREAFDDFFAVIDNFSSIPLKGVVHSFSDNKKNLQKCLNHDFYVGVNGLATYSTLPLPPLERTLLETDAPFLAPVPHRGEKNHSAFIPDIARWLAKQHQTTLDEIAKITTKNAETLFNI